MVTTAVYLMKYTAFKTKDIDKNIYDPQNDLACPIDFVSFHTKVYVNHFLVRVYD